MDIKKSILFVTAIVINTAIFAQKESFKFDTEKHNFGTIEEKGGPAVFKFEFTNTGSDPIKISKVKASCGCTTPSWDKEEIAPGAKGHVTASYNPKNRPGKFNKTLTVTSSTSDKIYFRISGNVTKAALPPEKKYPFLSGNLRFKNEEISIGSVMNDQVKEIKIPIYNITDGDIKLLDGATIPSHIKLELTDEGIIKAKKFANVTFKFDAKATNDWGKHTDELKFMIGEVVSTVKIASDIIENFSTMSDDEKEFAPVIKLSRTKLNYGTVANGKKVKSTITYTNNGRTDLIIRKVTSTCGCTVVKSKKNIIKPGKSGKLIVTLDTSEKDYNQNNMINLICNDPKSPVHSIQVRANIAE